MPFSTYMEIAGVYVAIECGEPIVLQESDPAYQPFFTKGEHDSRIPDFRIHLELKGMPLTKGLRKIFDSGQSWSMFVDGSEYYLAFRPPLHKETFWLARYDRDVTQVIIHCGEGLVNHGNGMVTVSNPLRYPLDQILLMYFLAPRQGALFHAAGLEYNGKGLIFPGKSGAGKSTLTRQFAGREEIRLLSDDRVVVRKIDEAFKAYGTPWPGDAGIAINKSISFSAIFFISHGSTNRIKEISPSEALTRLLPVTSIPWYDREVMPDMLQFCGDLISHIPTCELCFKPSVEVADVVEEYIATEKI